MRTFAQTHHQGSKQASHRAKSGSQMPPAHPAESEASWPSAALPRFSHEFGRIGRRPAPAGAMSLKQTISQPGDQQEQQADRLADLVMRMPLPQQTRACPCGGGCPMCRTHQPIPAPSQLLPLHGPASCTRQMVGPPAVQQGLATPGRPLDPNVHGTPLRPGLRLGARPCGCQGGGVGACARRACLHTGARHRLRCRTVCAAFGRWPPAART